MTEIHDESAACLSVSEAEKYILTGAADGVVKVSASVLRLGQTYPMQVWDAALPPSSNYQAFTGHASAVSEELFLSESGSVVRCGCSRHPPLYSFLPLSW